MIETLGGLFPPDDGPVVLDGALGSELRARGWPDDLLTHVASLERPDVVEAIHTEHIAAGAQVVLTNTFSCTIPKGPERDRAEIAEAITSSVAAARRAVAVHAATAVGRPVTIGASLSGWNLAAARDDATAAVRRLADEGVAFVVFETIGALDDALAALDVADDAAPELPVVVSCTTTDGSSHEHRRIRDIAEAVEAHERAAFGLNCCCGPHDLLRLASDLPRVPAWLAPNAGPPQARESDDVMAAFARAAVAAGARFVGGCCGTTPRTLETMAAAIER